MRNPFKKEIILSQTEIDLQRINLLLMQTDPNDPDFEILCDRKKTLLEMAVMESKLNESNTANSIVPSLLQTGAGVGLAAGLSFATKDKIFTQNNLVWGSVKKINFFDIFKNRR